VEEWVSFQLFLLLIYSSWVKPWEPSRALASLRLINSAAKLASFRNPLERALAWGFQGTDVRHLMVTSQKKCENRSEMWNLQKFEKSRWKSRKNEENRSKNIEKVAKISKKMIENRESCARWNREWSKSKNSEKSENKEKNLQTFTVLVAPKNSLSNAVAEAHPLSWAGIITTHQMGVGQKASIQSKSDFFAEPISDLNLQCGEAVSRNDPVIPPRKTEHQDGEFEITKITLQRRTMCARFACDLRAKVCVCVWRIIWGKKAFLCSLVRFNLTNSSISSFARVARHASGATRSFWNFFALSSNISLCVNPVATFSAD
jgi:hypothetical protein